MVFFSVVRFRSLLLCIITNIQSDFLCFSHRTPSWFTLTEWPIKWLTILGAKLYKNECSVIQAAAALSRPTGKKRPNKMLLRLLALRAMEWICFVGAGAHAHRFCCRCRFITIRAPRSEQIKLVCFCLNNFHLLFCTTTILTTTTTITITTSAVAAIALASHNYPDPDRHEPPNPTILYGSSIFGCRPLSFALDFRTLLPSGQVDCLYRVWGGNLFVLCCAFVQFHLVLPNHRIGWVDSEC